MPHSAKRFLSDDQGLETVEYAIISGLIVTGLLAIIVALGIWVKNKHNTLKTNLGA
jgi:Flp pilus assembly pilin Flp